MQVPEPIAKFHPSIKVDPTNILRLPYAIGRIKNNRIIDQDKSTLDACKREAQTAIEILNQKPSDELTLENINYFNKIIAVVDEANSLLHEKTSTAAYKSLNQQPAPSQLQRAEIGSIQKKIQTPSHMGLKTELILLDEYDTIEQYNNLYPSEAEVLRSKKNELEQMIRTFAEKHHISFTKDQDGVSVSDPSFCKGALTQAINNQQLTKKQLDFIVDSQMFWLEINQKFGRELDLNSFSLDKNLIGLTYLSRMARLTHPVIDDAIDLRIIEQYKNNRPMDNENQLNAIIQGGGPNGLITAFKLILSGAKVQLINERPKESFTRKQVVRIDPIWINQLQFILGSNFIPTFSGENGHVNVEDNVGEINISSLERPLLERLEKIQNKMASDQALRHETPLVISFPERLVDIKFNQDTGRYQAKCQKANSDETDSRDFNLLVFAGGSNDIMRDKFLGPAVTVTDSKEYSVCIWNKKRFDVNYLPKDSNGYPIFRSEMTLQEVSRNLARLNFNQFIQQNPDITNEIKQLFSNIEQQIAAIGGKITIRQFENAATIYIGSEIPFPLANLKTELQKLLNTLPLESPQSRNIKNTLKEIDIIWSNALLSKYGSLNDFNLTDRGINVGSFPVSQKYSENPILSTRKGGSPTFFITVGDGVCSPHFFSGSGLSGGLRSTDVLSNTVLEYHKSNASDSIKVEEFNNKINEGYSEIVEFTLNRGKPFLSSLNKTEINFNRRKATIEALEREVNDYQNIYFSKSGLNKTDYILHYDENSVQKYVHIEISPEGYILAQESKPNSKKIQYNSLFDFIRAKDLD